jgi:hypothetical protein
VTQQRDGPQARLWSVPERRRLWSVPERSVTNSVSVRSGLGASAEHGRVHPSEFEARGFSIPRLASGFVRRVGRLINGN